MATPQNRTKYISAASSEKITLATVDAKARFYLFSGPTLDIYSKVVPYFVAGLKQDDTDLTPVANLASVVEGTFYYDIVESTLYARFTGDADPQDVEVIVTYRLFYSNKGLQTSHNLQNVSEDVHWEGRIVSSPGYKHKIGIDQSLTSLVGEGTLKLKNKDGGLDNIFDTLIFENQSVVIYSWNQDLQPEESRVIYRGSVTNKAFDGNTVSFKIKDQIFTLLDAPDIAPYTNDDNVAESVKGQYKRRVYGRVDGLRSQATDQVADGIELTGTLSMVANTNVINGTGTLFLTEMVQDDTITVGTQEFTVDRIISDTQLTTTDEAEFAFGGQVGLMIPARGSTLRNRTFLSAGHICAEVTHMILSIPQFNRVQLASTDGLFAGDFIEFNDTSERIEIKTVAPGNIVVLTQNMVTKATVGTNITRRPVQEVYIEGRRVNADDFTVFNNSTGCGITFDTDVEFNLARPSNTVFTAEFNNSSKIVNITTTEVALSEVFTAGDFIKPDDITYSTFYKIIYVGDTFLTLSGDFLDPTITDIAEIVSPEYLTDDSVVSVNILGKTIDGTANGNWIQTAAEAERDLLRDINIIAVNETSFTDGSAEATQLISMAIPESFTSKSLPAVKEITDKLNISVRSSLTLDNNLRIKYQVLNVYTGEDLPVLQDKDVINWSLKSTNGKTYKTALVRYRKTDVDNNTLDPGNQFISYDSEFVSRYIGTTKVDELDMYLYEDRDAEIAAHRHLYYNSLSVATLKLTTDLRLENTEIGDVVIADFRRIYRRKGDDVAKKAMLVIGKTVNGERTTLELSDLGNTFNTSSYITPNTAPDFTAATSDEKLIYGYITDNQGIVNNEENTAGTHLIS